VLYGADNDGEVVPLELRRRQARLAKIEAAMASLDPVEGREPCRMRKVVVEPVNGQIEDARNLLTFPEGTLAHVGEQDGETIRVRLAGTNNELLVQDFLPVPGAPMTAHQAMQVSLGGFPEPRPPVEEIPRSGGAAVLAVLDVPAGPMPVCTVSIGGHTWMLAFRPGSDPAEDLGAARHLCASVTTDLPPKVVTPLVSLVGLDLPGATDAIFSLHADLPPGMVAVDGVDVGSRREINILRTPRLPPDLSLAQVSELQAGASGFTQESCKPARVANREAVRCHWVHPEEGSARVQLGHVFHTASHTWFVAFAQGTEDWATLEAWADEQLAGATVAEDL